jgi:integrase
VVLVATLVAIAPRGVLLGIHERGPGAVESTGAVPTEHLEEPMGGPKRRANGDAAPYYSEARQRWVQLIELPAGPDGKRRRKKVTGRTKSECKRKAHQARAELLTTGAVTDAAMTVRRLMADYMADATPGLKPRSVEQYQGWIDRYVVPYIGTRRVRDLRPADIGAWHNQLRADGYSTNTMRCGHRVLVQALNLAVRNDIVIRNVAKQQGGPADAGDIRRVEPLTAQQAADLLAGVDGWRYEALVWVLLGCGLRIGEALGLTWGAVDLDAGELHVRAQVQDLRGEGKTLVPYAKTAAGLRSVAVPAVVVAKLREHRKAMLTERMALGAGVPGDDDVVFPNEFHELGDRSNIARQLKVLGEQAGVEGVHPHRLRHTHVSLVLEAGVPLEAVSESVGHRKIGTTKDIYGRLQQRSRRRVADAIDGTLG